MKTKTRSVEQIIEEQVRRWQIMRTEEKKEEERISVVTFSRERGSGGDILAERLAEKLGYELFHQEVLHNMAESARVSVQFLETLDEKGVSVLDEWISSLVDRRHLWPDRYLQHLMKIIGTIGKHGRAIIIGRGSNFVLPPDKRLSIRVIAPMEERIRNVSKELDITVEEAKQRVIKTESDRKAFIKKYFNADIADIFNYDLIINTENLSIDEAVNIINGALN
ncbi:MAG: cytidylate kinase-like family protein [Deltaproteobacteria bacterium]|nr:cytidylate kinase-like family protein [Deltaproteobacteria bacterium]